MSATITVTLTDEETDALVASVVAQRESRQRAGAEPHAHLESALDKLVDAAEAEDARTYQINRVFKDDAQPTIKLYGGLTLEEAQAHCKDPSTSTSEYMDTYTEE